MGDTIGAVLGAGKNQGAVVISPFEQRHKQIKLLFARHRINRMGNGFSGRTAYANFHQLRIAQNPRREPLDLRRQCRGKKQSLPIGGNLLNDSAHVRQKSHVEHAVDLVEDENIDLPQVHRALLKVIEQTTRRGGDHVHAALNVFTLFTVTDAAMNDGHQQIGEAPIIAKRCLDLRG